MDDLVRWLGEQLDEDERIAREAQQNGDVRDGRWFDDEDEEVIDDSGWRIAFTVDSGTRGHIAEHDPARVLREIDAKQRIIAEHALNGWVCSTCDDGEVPPQAFPCPTLRLLALPYADRPGYRKEWAP